jgi:hypothetical protein
MRPLFLVLLASLYLLIQSTNSLAITGQLSNSYTIVDDVFTSSSEQTSTTNYISSSIVGQPSTTGISSSTNYTNSPGFLRSNFEAPGNGSFADGDMIGNGKISAVDALLVLRMAVQLDPVTAYGLAHGDMNGDGKITAVDALLVLRKAVGL